MIVFNQVSKVYPTGVVALYNVDLTIDTGEIAFITGQSGSGKTSLLKLVAMLERPTHGKVIVNGKTDQQINSMRMSSFRREIGMIFQDPHLLKQHSVFDNVALPLEVAGMADKDIKRRVEAALDKVELLHKAKAKPMMLSAGEQQRVGIARAVVNKPSIILADEPTGNLDPELAASIMQTFKNFNDLGTTVLIASHDHNLIKKMRKRVIVLQKSVQEA